MFLSCGFILQFKINHFKLTKTNVFSYYYHYNYHCLQNFVDEVCFCKIMKSSVSNKTTDFTLLLGIVFWIVVDQIHVVLWRKGSSILAYTAQFWKHTFHRNFGIVLRIKIPVHVMKQFHCHKFTIVSTIKFKIMRYWNVT